MFRWVAVLGVLLLIALSAVALVYLAPATWLTAQVASATQGRLQLARARGLWHRGSGILVFSSGTGGADAVHWNEAVQWDIAPAGLTHWKVLITWPEVGAPLAVDIRAGLSGWSVATPAWRGVLPLTALSGFGAPFNTLALEGSAEVNLSTLYYATVPGDRPVTPNRVAIHITNLRSAMVQGMVLGDYVAKAEAGSQGDKGEAVGGTYSLRTTQGALLLDGDGTCLMRQHLVCNFAGTARAARHDDALLGNLLGLLGRRIDQGSGKNPIVELRW